MSYKFDLMAKKAFSKEDVSRLTFQGQNRMGNGTENYIFIECSDPKQQLKLSTSSHETHILIE